MSSGAGDPTDQTSAPRRSRARLAAPVAIGVVLTAAVVLRFVSTSALWLDEALSVNIARLPLSDLPDALERDGAPPLYYVLLHLWTEGLGTSDLAVRSLSAVLSLATLPALFLGGRRVAGRAGAWAALLVGATLPFAFRFATEARMYALVMFLVAWGYLAFVRAWERPTVGRLALVTLVAAALLYTQNWSFYLLGVVFVAVAWIAWRGSAATTRRTAQRVVLALVVGGLLFVPWVPTLLFQLEHTGTPWGDPRLPWSGLASGVGGIGGVVRPYHGEAYAGAVLLVVLALLGVFGIAAGRHHVDLDLRTRPEARREAAVAAGALVVGLTLSYVLGTAFEPRYAAVVVPLLVLLIARGVTAFGDARVRAGVLAVVVLLGLAAGVRNAVDERTQAAAVADVLRRDARPGDLVVLCPDQLGPSVQRLLRDAPGLDAVTYPDLAAPELVDWVDYRDRIAASDPTAVAARVLDRAGDATLWYVASPGYRSVEGKCEELGLALSASRPDAIAHVVPDEQAFYEFMGLTELRAP